MSIFSIQTNASLSEAKALFLPILLMEGGLPLLVRLGISFLPPGHTETLNYNICSCHTEKLGGSRAPSGPATSSFQEPPGQGCQPGVWCHIQCPGSVPA